MMYLLKNFKKVGREFKRKGFKHGISRLLFGETVYTHSEHSDIFKKFLVGNIGRTITEMPLVSVDEFYTNKILIIKTDGSHVCGGKFKDSTLICFANQCTIINNDFNGLYDSLVIK